MRTNGTTSHIWCAPYILRDCKTYTTAYWAQHLFHLSRWKKITTRYPHQTCNDNRGTDRTFGEPVQHRRRAHQLVSAGQDEQLTHFHSGLNTTCVLCYRKHNRWTSAKQHTTQKRSSCNEAIFLQTMQRYALKQCSDIPSNNAAISLQTMQRYPFKQYSDIPSNNTAISFQTMKPYPFKQCRDMP